MHLARAGRPCRLGLCCACRRGGLPAAPVHAQRGAGVVGQHRRWRVGVEAVILEWDQWRHEGAVSFDSVLVQGRRDNRTYQQKRDQLMSRTLG